MMGRFAKLLLIIVGVFALSWPMHTELMPRLVWNASESVPIGLYRVRPSRAPAISNLVIVKPPKPLARFLSERGYLPIGVPLIKRVLALPGQSVCRNNLLITVDGVAMGAALERDRRGRPLPIWQGCSVIPSGEIFLMNRDETASLDGRYFGPIPISAIVGEAEPIWTFGEH